MGTRLNGDSDITLRGRSEINRDFHYYGTYTAARLAGFDRDDATIIAHSAQYVDDSTRDRILDPEELSRLSTGTNISFHGERSDHEPADIELRRVWVPFHFLPGNFSPPLKVSALRSRRVITPKREICL